ncbi:MAG TPA: hypothetical protein PLN69_10980 [bacterium]|nr:hypothetical protein [bacterium]
MKQRKLRAALAGVGDISMMHQPGYVDNPDCELYAICDPKKELLEMRAREWGVEKTYLSYEDLLGPGGGHRRGAHPARTPRGHGRRRRTSR